LKPLARLLNETLSFPYRYIKLTKRIAPLLTGAAEILDVGTGDGRLAQYLINATGARITGLDVHLQPHSYIPVHQYDGCLFPFEDNSFDAVLLIDMLHHTANIDQLLLEASRVARQFVLVKDHYWNTRVDKYMLYLGDYIGNIPYGVPITYNFLNLPQWTTLFSRHRLGELHRLTFKYNRFEPAHHILVKLQAAGLAPHRRVSEMLPRIDVVDAIPLREPEVGAAGLD
jgi:SAM-dependent methyltransferase